MSRLNWNECDSQEAIRNAALWSGRWTVQRRSKREQALFREMEAVLLALPEKKLIGGRLVKDGCGCAGAELLISRAMREGETRESALAQLAGLHAWRVVEYGEPMNDVLEMYGVQNTVAFMLVAENDGGYCEKKMTDEQRYEHVLAWVRAQIVSEVP